MYNNNVHLMAIFLDNPCKPVSYQNVSILDFIRAKDDGWYGILEFNVPLDTV